MIGVASYADLLIPARPASLLQQYVSILPANVRWSVNAR